MTKSTSYRSLTPELIAELERIVGKAHVVRRGDAQAEDYAHDEAASAAASGGAELVVKPGSAEEIAAIMKLANRERFPVTPRGAGSGLSGGAVPVSGGVVLSVERMSRILEIDRQNLVAVVEPGVVTNAINEAVAPFGLFYAGYPMSVEMCFVGGNVAENAGGGRAVKYGVTSRYVMGLEVVLPTGEIIEVGGKRVKDVTGYDLVHLFVGSEGTLGIFTKIVLRLVPVPVARAALLVPFADVEAAIAIVPRVLTEGHVVPSSIELMDRMSFETAYAHIGEPPPHPEAGAMLLFEVDGPSAADVEAQYEAIGSLCLEAGALDVLVGDTPEKARRMWHPRQVCAEALKKVAPEQSLEDVVVPIAQIPTLVREVEALGERYGVRIPTYGHAGDGNLHATVLRSASMTDAAWRETLPAVLQDLYRAVTRLGGTLSGEHGVGSKRRGYLPLVQDPALISLQRRIKAAFDPEGILNPGKIFPDG